MKEPIRPWSAMTARKKLELVFGVVVVIVTLTGLMIACVLWWAFLLGRL